MKMDKIAAGIIIFGITVAVPWMMKIYVDNQVLPIKSDVRVLRAQFNFYLRVNGVQIPDQFKLRGE